MKAELDPVELTEALALVTKGVRGKKNREMAQALLVFSTNSVAVEFNDCVAVRSARVSENGEYALNPFLFRSLLGTYRHDNVTVEIDEERITIGHMRIAHARMDGSRDKPGEAVGIWLRYRELLDRRRQERLQEEASRTAADRRTVPDLLRDARYVAYKRTDGGIEYGAAVLQYEKGKPGNRRVFVKTKDFLESWINELEIVSYGKDPKLSIE